MPFNENNRENPDVVLDVGPVRFYFKLRFKAGM